MPLELKGSKKVQLDKDKTVIFALVSIAAVVVVGALMISKGLWGQVTYLSKVSDKKEAAVDQLKANKAAVGTLVDSYNAFVGKDINLLSGNPNGDGERDGTNDALVLDALPSKYDFPAVTSSIEKLLAGYTINGIGGIDDNLAQQAAIAAGPVEIPFKMSILTNYDNFKALTVSLNKSIRPFQIVKVELRGTNGNLDVAIDAKTFYQPETGLKVTEEEVP